MHKKLGNTHLALMNFSWAMDLDPKGVNNQIKEAIDKRYATEEDDTLARLTDTSEWWYTFSTLAVVRVCECVCMQACMCVDRLNDYWLIPVSETSCANTQLSFYV